MANYSYYSTIYYGSIIEDEKQFNRLYRRALSIIDRYTFGRSSRILNVELLDKINITACELADLLSISDGSSNLSSESNAEWSVSYNNDSFDSDVKTVIYNNLSTTGLLYRGV